MRAVTVRTRGSLEFNMTPMIDVTFLLIIFFVLAGQLSRQETVVELDLPEAQQGRPPKEQVPRLVIANVTPTGEVLLGGELVDQAEFANRIRFEVQRSQGDLEVRIRGDRSVPYRVIEPLLVSCAEAGVWNVGFMVVRDGN